MAVAAADHSVVDLLAVIVLAAIAADAAPVAASVVAAASVLAAVVIVVVAPAASAVAMTSEALLPSMDLELLHTAVDLAAEASWEVVAEAAP